MSLNTIIAEDVKNILKQDINWKKFDNTTVLISGANGFLPAYMVETLLFLNDETEANIKVIALVRNEEKARLRFQHHAYRTDLVFIVQDVCDDLNTDNLGPVDFVIHAASPATPGVYGTDPVGTMLPNLIGTNNLLKLSHINSVQGFLFFSSGEVYGETSAQHIPTMETFYGHIDPIQVRSCYGESKRAGETLSISWHHQYGVPVKIARLFHTYGPGMSLTDGRVFADFVADIIHGRNIVMKSDGLQTRAFCYLTDAIAGLFTVLLEGEPGEAYNVGVDKETSIRDLAEMLVALFPERKLQVSMEIPKETPNKLTNKISRTCPDISKLKTLGWSPQTQIELGFKRTILSYEID